MKIGSFNIGHDAAFVVFEEDECKYFEDLSRTFRVKSISCDVTGSKCCPVMNRIKALVDAFNPDVLVCSINPGDFDEFASSLMALGCFPGFSGTEYISREIWRELLDCGRCRLSENAWLVEHGIAHIYSAYMTSSFGFNDRVLGLSLDGWSTVGWDTVVEMKNGLIVGDIRRTEFSIGGTFFDQYLSRILFGREDLSAPGKIMGLAQIGEVDSNIVGYLRELFEYMRNDVTSFSSHQRGIEEKCMDTFRKFPGLGMFGNVDSRNQFVQNFMASAQFYFSKLLVESIGKLVGERQYDCVAYAGGCALSVVTNTMIREALDLPLHIPPFSNDSGQAYGAAACIICMESGLSPNRGLFFPFIGSSYSHPSIGNIKDIARKCSIEEISEIIFQGGIVGWFEGEYAVGPRALGHRSIFASPQYPGMRGFLNHSVKNREWYRPYGAICPQEKMENYFCEDVHSPYMLYSHYGADSLVEMSPECFTKNKQCRIQSIDEKWLPLQYELLQVFGSMSGASLLINTSLNTGGLPIASSLEHAIKDSRALRLSVLIYVDSNQELWRMKNVEFLGPSNCRR